VTIDRQPTNIYTAFALDAKDTTAAWRISNIIW